MILPSIEALALFKAILEVVKSADSEPYENSSIEKVWKKCFANCPELRRSFGTETRGGGVVVPHFLGNERVES